MTFTSLESSKQWKLFPFLHKIASIFKGWSILFRAKPVIFWRGVESQTVFITKRKSSVFTEISETSKGHLRFLFLLYLLQIKLSLINFETENRNSSFWCILMTGNLKTEISKISKNDLGKFIPNLTHKHVIATTNLFWKFFENSYENTFARVPFFVKLQDVGCRHFSE